MNQEILTYTKSWADFFALYLGFGFEKEDIQFSFKSDEDSCIILLISLNLFKLFERTAQEIDSESVALLKKVKTSTSVMNNKATLLFCDAHDLSKVQFIISTSLTNLRKEAELKLAKPLGEIDTKARKLINGLPIRKIEKAYFDRDTMRFCLPIYVGNLKLCIEDVDPHKVLKKLKDILEQ